MKVLVTDVTANSGMAVIRSLARHGWTVAGAAVRRLPFNVHSRYTKPYHVVPQPREARYVERLLAVLKGERADVLLPVSAPRPIVEHQDRLSRWCRLLLPPPASYDVADDNQRTIEECRPLGIPCPRIYTAAEAEETLAGNASASGGVRLVVKPRRNVGGARGLSIVGDTAALHAARRLAEDRFGPAVIQEYIPGGPSSMVTANLLFDRQSRLRAWFTTRKLRQWPNTGGITALSVSTRDRRLVDLVLPFFHRRCWRGPAEVEFKVDERTGTPTLIEINPRFWSYIGFPVRCGVDFPALTCTLAVEKAATTLACPRYRAGVKYLNPGAYIRSVLAELRGGSGWRRTLEIVRAELSGRKVGNMHDPTDWILTAVKTVSELTVWRKVAAPADPGIAAHAG
jgi:predicted ATP-grasp superfamily ATP-dependent carboligase